ncbi:hypothetical protein JS562_54655, partial [Agrobacterium sp. S2]|nr:hypothetical protein [Agrobacterium sp. S2]
GISVVQTAEGALTETHSILQRMRTLSVQASNNGGLSDTAKSNIQDEMDQLKTELTRISDTTSFNGKKLLDGSYSGVFQVGANTSAQDKITVDLTTVTGGLGASGLGVADVDVTKLASTTGASSATEDIDLTDTAAPVLTVKTSATSTVTLDLADWDDAGTVEAAVKNKQLLTDKMTSAVANTQLTFSIGGGTAATDAVITLNAPTEYADA